MIVFKVTTEGDCEGRTIRTLGYCTGCTEEMAIDYYASQKEYNIFLEKISVIDISPEKLKERIEILKEISSLEERLKYLNDKL